MPDNSMSEHDPTPIFTACLADAADPDTALGAQFRAIAEQLAADLAQAEVRIQQIMAAPPPRHVRPIAGSVLPEPPRALPATAWNRWASGTVLDPTRRGGAR